MKVFPTRSQCAHVWAQQTQEEGRCGNVSFRGDTFYSYATPIARIVAGRGGARALLVTSKSYSVTTSRHCSMARGAVGTSHVFVVPSLGRCEGRNYGDVTGRPDHKRNLAALVEEYRAELRRLSRARTHTSPDWASRIAEAANDYARLFGFKPRIASVDEDLAAVMTPEWRERQRRAEERDAERRRQQDARWAAIREQERIDMASRLPRWRAGEAFGYVSVTLPDGTAALRVKPGDPETVQTSLGAEVPAREAERLYRFLASFREARPGEAYTPNVSRTVGHFTLRDMDAEGVVRVGCHRFQWAEVEAFACSQGW